jgi:phosphopentomutase
MMFETPSQPNWQQAPAQRAIPVRYSSREALSLSMDTLDAQTGLSLTVLGGNQVSENDVLATAREVRSVVDLPRVIACHIPHLDVNDTLARHCRVEPGTTGPRYGLNDCLSGIFTTPFTEHHLPHPMRGNNLLVDLVARDIPVTLIGKTADLFADAAPGATGHPAASISAIEHHLRATLNRQTEGLIFVNDRQIDLASHTGNPAAAAAALAETDATIGAALATLTATDLLIVTADHGNDPATRDGNHTYESVPVLATSRLRPPAGSSLGYLASCIAGTLMNTAFLASSMVR